MSRGTRPTSRRTGSSFLAYTAVPLPHTCCRGQKASISTSSGQYTPSVQYHPSSRSSQEPVPSLTPVLDPGPAPPLSPACSPFATVVHQEGQPRLSQVLAHQAGAFREGQAARVLEKKPRRAAASWVQGEEVP